MTRQASDRDESSYRPGHDTDGYEKITVAAAAARVGTSQDAVRKRVQRNTIKWTKDDGRVFVYLDPSETSQATDQDVGQDGATQALIEELRSHNEQLREILHTHDEEIRRKDHLLAAALERIPAIEAPSESPRDERESPVTASEDRGNGERVVPATQSRRSAPGGRGGLGDDA